MKARDRHLACDLQPVEQFLGQQLGPEEQSEFERHLDTCVTCRRRLEQAAANREDWNLICQSLSSIELSEVESSSTSSSSESACYRTSTRDPDSQEETSFPAESVLELLSPTDDEHMLGRLGAYEIAGVVGIGGMGVVLKAYDLSLNRYVAIKVLAPTLGTSGAARTRFMREAQAAAAVIHNNVIEIHGVSNIGGLPYLVMPYVRGPSLQSRLDAEGPLSLAEILRISAQAAAGLAAAHAQGLVHRDVKPANILLADGVSRVKLTDFGLARAADDASLTKTGVIAGTPQFMSPEQAKGEPIDARSDLFSLASVMYVMCTGRLPFRAETSYGILRRITDTEPRPIQEVNTAIPDWLVEIIGMLHAKSPADRLESAEALSELLNSCLAHVQQRSASKRPVCMEQLRVVLESSRQRASNDERPSAIAPQRQPNRKRMVGMGMLAAAIVLATGFSFWSWFSQGNTVSFVPSLVSNSEQTSTGKNDSHSRPPGHNYDADDGSGDANTVAELEWEYVDQRFAQLRTTLDDFTRTVNSHWPNQAFESREHPSDGEGKEPLSARITRDSPEGE